MSCTEVLKLEEIRVETDTLVVLTETVLTRELVMEIGRNEEGRYTEIMVLVLTMLVQMFTWPTGITSLH